MIFRFRIKFPAKLFRMSITFLTMTGEQKIEP